MRKDPKLSREQLDAIRARVEAAPKAGDTYIDENGDEVRILEDGDMPALLAEVDRLTAEVESKVAQNVALVGMNGRLQQEVERLTADPLPAAAWVREVERSAFKRGVAAMREAAASHFSVVAPYDYIAPRILSIPDPEDTP